MASSVAMASSACSTAPSPPNPLESETPPITIAATATALPVPPAQELRELAIANGASANQVAVIDMYVVGEEISYAQLASLLPDLSTCLEHAGLTFIDAGASENASGLLLPEYSYGDATTALGPEQLAAVGITCEQTHFSFALDAYVNQPSSRALADARVREQLPDILACLSEHGVTIEPDAPLDEIRMAVLALRTETGEATNGEGTVMCAESL